MSAFLNWAAKNRYIASDLEVKKVKISQKPVIALSAQQVRKLIGLVSQHPTLRLRILLAVTTGLRRGDIESIRIGDIHFDRNTITTRNRKAKKSMAERPVPEQIVTELSNYVATLSDGQQLLFTKRFPEKRWNKIRGKLGLPDLKFHDLRKHADTPIMPSKVLHNGPLSRTMAYIVQFNNVYSA
jgi:integrase